MDNDRLRWITRPATLDSWQSTVTYAHTPSGVIATVTVLGFCNRKRGSLWQHTESLMAGGGDYSADDLLLHVSMVCSQDRPANQAQFDRAMVGAAWDQPTLPGFDTEPF